MINLAQHLELLQPKSDLPNTIVKDERTIPVIADIALGFNKLHQRLESLMLFLTDAAANGQCGCVYVKNPNCTVCRAKELLSQIEVQDAPPAQTPQTLI